MSTAIQASRTGRAAAVASRLQISDRAIGLLLACVLPALFWVGVIAFAGRLVGNPPAFETLAVVGVVIASFLAAVVGGLMARH